MGYPGWVLVCVLGCQSVREKVGDAIVARGKHRVKWDSPDVSAWVTELSERVFTLQVRQHAPHAYTCSQGGPRRAETAREVNLLREAPPLRGR